MTLLDFIRLYETQSSDKVLKWHAKLKVELEKTSSFGDSIEYIELIFNEILSIFKNEIIVLSDFLQDKQIYRRVNPTIVIKMIDEIKLDLITDLFSEENLTEYQPLWVIEIITRMDQLKNKLCATWGEADESQKNMYMTLFECLPVPLMILNCEFKLVSLNYKALNLLRDTFKKDLDENTVSLKALSDMDYPSFFGYDFVEFINNTNKSNDHFLTVFIKSSSKMTYSVEIMKMIAVSGAFAGVVIMFTLLQEVIDL